MGPLGFACCMHVVANFTGMGDSYDDTTCAERCGPTCFGYGRVINATQGSNGCGICLSPVQNNKTNNDCNKLDSKKFWRLLFAPSGHIVQSVLNFRTGTSP